MVVPAAPLREKKIARLYQCLLFQKKPGIRWGLYLLIASCLVVYFVQQTNIEYLEVNNLASALATTNTDPEKEMVVSLSETGFRQVDPVLALPRDDGLILGQHPSSSFLRSHSQLHAVKEEQHAPNNRVSTGNWTQPVIRGSDLPDASDWQATEETPYEVCFVTATYSSSTDLADQPPNVRDMSKANPTFRFYAFTNLDNLDAPGWKVMTHTNFSSPVMTNPTFQRFITQSRWPKFMGWQHPQVYGCQAVFYMDGFCSPKEKHAMKYKQLSKAIAQSKYGIFQNLHDASRGPLHELDRILVRQKDVAPNVQSSKDWLLSQPDFRADAPVYANHYIGYSPKSKFFQQASLTFWKRYSLEKDSWRDQPLWSYVLDKYGIVPTRLGTFEALFKEHYKRMAAGGHRYSDETNRNAAAEKKAANKVS